MRKRGFAVLALSAMLAFGTASLTAYAAGWQQSGSNWVYVESDGRQVTNEWRKGADGLWRYLDGQGAMVLSSWVDDEYYVDSNGIMVTDKWMKLAKKNRGWDSSGEMTWYYFGNSGKAYTDGWKKISGKYYYFDTDGMMQTGWVDDNAYYLGDDGAMRTGWVYLKDPDDDFDDENNVPYGDDNSSHWYYFQSSGKKYVPSLGSADYKLYKIDGFYYCFDSEGRMQTGWVKMGDKDDGNFENYRLFGDDGKVKTGWYSTTPPEDEDSSFNFDDEVQWYYFTSSGVPKVGPPVEDASTGDLEKINGITYLFNEKGNPVYGLRKLRVGSGDEYATYYFGPDKATSSVVKGKGTVVEGDGSKWEYYFTESGSKAGRGFTGVKNDYVFYQGRLQKAEDGSKYEPIRINNNIYLVNSSGKIVKSTTVRGAGSTKYKTNSKGEILEIDGETNNGSSEAREPSEPAYWDE